MLTRPGHEPTIYRIGSRHANEQRTRTGYCRLQLRDEIGVNISCCFFYSFSAQDPIFYRRQKIGPTFRSFIRVSFGARRPQFLLELFCCDQSSVVPLLDNVTPIFMGLNLVHTIPFLSQTNYWLERSHFLDQKIAQTFRFSLRYLVYDKKSV